MIQWFYMGVSVEFQRCYIYFTEVLLGCYKNIILHINDESEARIGVTNIRNSIQ